MKKQIRYVSFLVAFFTAQLAYSQAFTYYPFNSVFSVSTNPKKLFWMDFRFQANSYFTSLGTEIAPMINYTTIGVAKLYVGGGVRFNFLNYLNDDPSKRKPLEGYFASIGMRASPFPNAPGVQVAFELSPDVSKAVDIGQLRARLGVAYVFERKK